MTPTLLIKRQPNADQAQALRHTMERFHVACNAIAETALREHTAHTIRLPKLVDANIRATFGLSAPMTVRAISQVAAASKRDKTVQPTFHPHGAIGYDPRILSWKGLDRVSILTWDGRPLIPGVMEGDHRAWMDRMRGQADLMDRDGPGYLAVGVDVPKPPPLPPDDWLGGDLGSVTMAAGSDGQTDSGGQVNGRRKRPAKLRQRVQRKGTQSAPRLLTKRRQQASRFAADVTHPIAQRLVAKAKDTGRGMALEDLQGIRERVTVRKAPRRPQHRWAFYQLRTVIADTARLAGVPVIVVDPRHTSRTCPPCGLIAQRHRPHQASFRCIGCGFAGPADTIAAGNIARRAAANQPDAGSLAETPARSALLGRGR